VTIPVRGQAGTAIFSEDDLDGLYPEELGFALAERRGLLAELAKIAPAPRDGGALKAKLEREVSRIDRRLWLHNRRARGAHMALAGRLGGGWADFLSSLARALNHVERLLQDLAPAADWARLGPARDWKMAQVLAEATLWHLSGLVGGLGQPLDRLEAKMSGLPAEAPKGAGAPAWPQGDDAGAPAGPREDAAGAQAGPREDDADAPIGPRGDDAGAPAGPRGDGPGLLADLARLRAQAPKGRKDMASHVLELGGLLGRFRSFFLARLLEAEETVLSWRGQARAPVAAPQALLIPNPVPSPRPMAVPDRPRGDARGRGWRLRRGLILVSLVLAALAIFLWRGRDRDMAVRPRQIHAYNGLAAPVTVILDRGRRLAPWPSFPLPPGGSATLDLPDREFSLGAISHEGLIEELDEFPAIGAGQSLVYNVAGASPLLEWEAVYAPDEDGAPPPERRLGAPRLMATDADYVFADPPKSIRTRGGDRTRLVLSALSGVHPARMLELLGAGERLGVIEAQARWDKPGGLWTPLWLDLLASSSPRAALILRARLDDFPRDPWTIGYLLKAAGPEDRAGLCRELGTLTSADPGDPNLAYLASLCLPPPERSRRLGELLKIWPDQPWLNRAAGWERFAQDDLEGAMWYLGDAFEADPSVLLPELETLARLRHFFGLPASALAEEFNFWVPGLAALTERESARSRENFWVSSKYLAPSLAQAGQDQAYILLDQGYLDQALAVLGPGPILDRLARLAGASDMASEAQIAQALALPPDRGLDMDTAWAMLGLALKTGQPTGAYEAMILATSPPPAGEIVAAIKKGDAPALGGLILGREAWLQGQACLAAGLAGLAVPEKCPLKARGFLFVGEKPALSPLDGPDQPVRPPRQPLDAPAGAPAPRAGPGTGNDGPGPGSLPGEPGEAAPGEEAAGGPGRDEDSGSQGEGEAPARGQEERPSPGSGQEEATGP
jgi:hypothetical protein